MDAKKFFKETRRLTEEDIVYGVFNEEYGNLSDADEKSFTNKIMVNDIYSILDDNFE